MTEKLLANAYIKGASDLLQGKIEGMPKIVVIPERATNGDIVKTMFPTCRPVEGTMLIDTDIAVFEPDWWNAPYKGSEEE